MARTYQLGIVGESNYQRAIGRCSTGDAVQIVHEPDNPYDDCALAVVTMDGETIGYIPRACWLQDAIHDEGKGCDAAIKSINTAGDGLLGVVLDVTLNSRGVTPHPSSGPQ
jgi:hypothetical protein